MALAKKQSKSSSIIIVGVVVVLVLGLGYFVYTRFFQNTGSGTGNSIGSGNRSLLINFDTKILKDPRVVNLQDFQQSVSANVNDAGQPYPFQ